MLPRRKAGAAPSEPLLAPPKQMLERPFLESVRRAVAPCGVVGFNLLAQPTEEAVVVLDDAVETLRCAMVGGWVLYSEVPAEECRQRLVFWGGAEGGEPALCPSLLPMLVDDPAAWAVDGGRWRCVHAT